MTLEEYAREVYSRLDSRIPIFPHRCCKLAVIEMSKGGYEIVFGYVLLNNYCRLGIKKKLPHYWIYDPKEEVNVDITSHQFNKHLSKEKKLPEIAFWRKEELDIYEIVEKNVHPAKVI